MVNRVLAWGGAAGVAVGSGVGEHGGDGPGGVAGESGPDGDLVHVAAVEDLDVERDEPVNPGRLAHVRRPGKALLTTGFQPGASRDLRGDSRVESAPSALPGPKAARSPCPVRLPRSSLWRKPSYLLVPWSSEPTGTAVHARCPVTAVLSVWQPCRLIALDEVGSIDFGRLWALGELVLVATIGGEVASSQWSAKHGSLIFIGTDVTSREAYQRRSCATPT